MTPITVTDENHHTHTLAKLLGQGGQGKVYATWDTRLAVKILHAPTQSRREELRRKLTFLRSLDLDGIPLASPLSILRAPQAGYVMRFLAEMHPIGKLSEPGRNEELLPFYIRTGGLRRRLQLLAKAASALAQLHSKGLVYADLSPNNLYVSADTTYGEVCLIDTDNLQYATSGKSSTIFTPRYGAPEIYQGVKGVSSLTDSYAFAIVAFETLCLVHPLIGDLVDDGEPELEQQALSGALPWIDHPDDRRNATARGIPRDLVLSHALSACFARTFEAGLSEPLERPGLAEWAEALHSAADNTLICPTCQSSYYAGKTVTCCPFCDAERPPCIRAAIRLWDPDNRGSEATQRVIGAFCLTEDGEFTVTNRHISGEVNPGGEKPIVSIKLKGSVLHCTPHESPSLYWLSAKTGEYRQLRAARFHVDLNPSPFNLHFGVQEAPHRYLTFYLQR